MIEILLVEDDKSFGYVLSEYMTLKNYKVTWAESAQEAIQFIEENSFQLAILDINLKHANGFAVADAIKAHDSQLPFIFLTARDLKVDQLKGYRYGAEEYITKPIDEEILIAKIEAILARYTTTDSKDTAIIFREISLHKTKRELLVHKQKIQLTEREAALMAALIEQPETLVNRKVILQNLWEDQDEFSRNSMDVYISRLRKHLASSSVRIRNVHGKGFVLE